MARTQARTRVGGVGYGSTGLVSDHVASTELGRAKDTSARGRGLVEEQWATALQDECRATLLVLS